MALTTAVPLAKGSMSRLIVIVPRVVSYALRLDKNGAAADFLARRYRDFIRDFDCDAQIRLCVCRRVDDVVLQLLPPGGTVVVGGRAGRWFPSEEAKLVRRLTALGHHVVFVPMPQSASASRIESLATMLSLLAVLLPAAPRAAAAQTTADGPWQIGGFVDVGCLGDFNSPSNHLFRSRGTTPRVDELDLNMIGAAVRRQPSDASRWGTELTVQGGRDSEIFGFSATAPNLGGAGWLRHLGPTNLSYLAPAGKGLTLQGGVFSSLIGYDSLYAKDNLTYTRPWGADYTPYLMLGISASYPFSDKVTITLGLVNGYWHLAHANDVPSVVGQAAIKMADRVTLKQTLLYGPHQPDTSLEFWRVLSDTIVERKSDRFTAAFEYQFGRENVDAPGRPTALWVSAQLPLHWVVRGPWSLTVRPEAAWDRDGRWIGAPESVTALTTAVEYRRVYRKNQAIFRIEHRFDQSHGAGGGFFIDRDAAANALTPRQNLLIAAAVVTFDTTLRD